LDKAIMLLRINARKNGTFQTSVSIDPSFPSATMALDGRSDTVVPGHILLQLAPCPHERDRPQIIEVQAFLIAPLVWPAADIGFAVVFQSALVFQVGDKHGVVLKRRVLLEAHLRQFLDELPVFFGNRIFIFVHSRGQPGGKQLLAIVLEMRFGAIHAGNRLALDGELDGMVGDMFSM
jgi:hypothetical protein